MLKYITNLSACTKKNIYLVIKVFKPETRRLISPDFLPKSLLKSQITFIGYISDVRNISGGVYYDILYGRNGILLMEVISPCSDSVLSGEALSSWCMYKLLWIWVLSILLYVAEKKHASHNFVPVHFLRSVPRKVLKARTSYTAL